MAHTAEPADWDARFRDRVAIEVGKIGREITGRQALIRRQPWRLFRNMRYRTEIATLRGWAEGMTEAVTAASYDPDSPRAMGLPAGPLPIRQEPEPW